MTTNPGESNDSNPKREAPWYARSPGLAIVALASLAVVVLAVWAGMVDHGPGISWAEYGDSFAPVVGFLSTVALGAAVLSVFLQRHDLELTRHEMIEQRKEMIEQRKEMEAQRVQSERANDIAEAQVRATQIAIETARTQNDLERRSQLIAAYSVASALEEILAKGPTSERQTAYTILGERAAMRDSMNGKLRPGATQLLDEYGHKEMKARHAFVLEIIEAVERELTEVVVSGVRPPDA